MTDKHTPTPWKVHPYVTSCGPYNKGIDIGPGQRAVAAVIGEFENPKPGAEAEANAAFIVRAVNSHDELVAVARSLRCLETSPRFNTMTVAAAIEELRANGAWADARAALSVSP